MTSELTTSGRRYGAQSADERHAARRARLLEAALDAFGTVGYAETAIGPLCAAAKVSTRNFYEHFESREALLLALHDEINLEVFGEVIAAMGEHDPLDFPSRARAGVAAYFRSMTSDRRRARIAVIETVGVSVAAERHRAIAIGRFADLLTLEATRLAEAGVVPPRDHALISVALVGAVIGLLNTWAAETDWDAHVDDVVTVATDLIVGAIT